MAAIRTARREDIDTIQRVARTTWHATYDGILGPEAVDTKVDEWYDDEDGIDVASLHAIYLHPDRWGDGIGSQLFDALTDRLRQRGYDRLIRFIVDLYRIDRIPSCGRPGKRLQ